MTNHKISKKISSNNTISRKILKQTTNKILKTIDIQNDRNENKDENENLSIVSIQDNVRNVRIGIRVGRDTAIISKTSIKFTKAKYNIISSSICNFTKKYEVVNKQNMKDINKFLQKREIKNSYTHSSKITSHRVNSTIKQELKKDIEKVKFFFKAPSQSTLLSLVIVIMVVYSISQMASCSNITTSLIGSIFSTSYTANESDIKGVDEDYTGLENALRLELDSIKESYPGYDEYDIANLEISHDPYALAAYLTVLNESYKRIDLHTLLQKIFEKQYELKVVEEIQKRKKTENKTGINTITDPFTGDTRQETYTYQVEIEYDYKILHVYVENTPLETIINSSLNEKQKKRYQFILQNKGNRPNLFTEYLHLGREDLQYQIPGEALSNVKFSKMYQEATRYLGKPYVWGGYNPSTGSDCSGYVSYVINHCGNGWNYGRLTAEGWRKSVSIIPSSEAKPGDLIFFQGSQKSLPLGKASHIGIYLGNGKMIHSSTSGGVKYGDINSNWCQSHFLCYGRLP